MAITRNLVLLFLTALAIGGCASTTGQASDQDEPTPIAPTHVVIVPHPGGNHIGGDQPLEDNPQ